MKIKGSNEYVVTVSYITMENEIYSYIDYFSFEPNADFFIQTEDEGLLQGLGTLFREFTICEFNIKTGERLYFLKKKVDQKTIKIYERLKNGKNLNLFEDRWNEDD